jgi:hypothetical protein
MTLLTYLDYKDTGSKMIYESEIIWNKLVVAWNTIA